MQIWAFMGIHKTIKMQRSPGHSDCSFALQSLWDIMADSIWLRWSWPGNPPLCRRKGKTQAPVNRFQAALLGKSEGLGKAMCLYIPQKLLGFHSQRVTFALLHMPKQCTNVESLLYPDLH